LSPRFMAMRSRSTGQRHAEAVGDSYSAQKSALR
jgi:hypothetical protein